MDRASDPYKMGYQDADGHVISDAEQLARVRAQGDIYGQNKVLDWTRPLSDAGAGGGFLPTTAEQREALRRGYGPRTPASASRMLIGDDLAEGFFGAWDRGAGQASTQNTVAGTDYGDALTAMNGGAPGAGAFETGMTPRQFGQSMIDMYVKAPLNLIPGLCPVRMSAAVIWP